MFRNIILKFRGSRCVLPEANTPFKKSFCMATGIIVTIGTGMLCIYISKIIPKGLDNIPNKVWKELISGLKPITKKIESVDIYNSPCIESSPIRRAIYPLTLSIIGTLSCVMLAYCIRDVSKIFVNDIRSKECCNIVRSTAYFTTTVPIFTVIMLTCVMVSYVSWKDYYYTVRPKKTTL